MVVAATGKVDSVEGAPTQAYWEGRKDAIYLFAAREMCRRFCPEPRSVIDVGSNRTPTLEWHRGTANKLVSLDLKRPYEAPGVESLTQDFFDYSTVELFDLVTCFQVLEHVPDAAGFAQKLLTIGVTIVATVPYKWRKGSCKFHLHDPVDEGKMRGWFGRDPAYSYMAREIGELSRDNKNDRLIHVYKNVQ